MADIRLIDANALLDRNNWTIKQYSGKEADAWRDGIALMKKNIENAPTIDPRTLLPAAHWEGQYDGYSNGEPIYDVWECSTCGYTIDDGTDCEDDLPRYCPNCGAKMR